MTPTVYAQQLAEVVRQLQELDVTADDPQLFTRAQAAFQDLLGGPSGTVVQRALRTRIDEINLTDDNDIEISRDNIRAVSALYVAAQLEDLKFFAVADKVADHFITGQIPISRSPGSNAVFQFYKDAVNRLTESDRRGIYARTFGLATGSIDEPMPNREFSDLWIRFLTSVSMLRREVAAYERRTVTEPQVVKNARDLAVNLSLHGYGVGHFAAAELDETIKKVIKMLSYPDVMAAYGVSNVWQLVERVSALYLGGSVNSVRLRTMATAGQRVILYLYKKQPVLIGRGVTLGLNVDDASLDPDNRSVVQDVEEWLAVTGTDDTSVEKYAEPVAITSQPTIPSMSLQATPDALSAVIGRTNGIGSVQGALQSAQQLASAIKA